MISYDLRQSEKGGNDRNLELNRDREQHKTSNSKSEQK